jgi:NDP-mannose synthase
MQAIILAGGKGSRLKPFTTNIPKPLVPLGDMPILEIILRQLKYRGVTRVTLAVNHLSELMIAFFGNGKKLGLEIDYSLEEQALGTAGPLSLVKNLDENFIVMNGDILTTMNFSDFFANHLSSKRKVTIATFAKEVKIDLGVLKIEGSELIDYIEKPTYQFDVSMGVYSMHRSALEFIPKNRPFDLPDLIKVLIARNAREVNCYKGDFEWLDIGRVDDFEQANTLFCQNREKYLPHV